MEKVNKSRHFTKKVLKSSQNCLTYFENGYILIAKRLEIKSIIQKGETITTMNRTYGKLREEIKKKFPTIEAFSSALNRDRSTISAKLNGKVAWTQKDIEDTCKLLDIPMTSVSEYFFY